MDKFIRDEHLQRRVEQRLIEDGWAQPDEVHIHRGSFLYQRTEARILLEDVGRELWNAIRGRGWGRHG